MASCNRIFARFVRLGLVAVLREAHVGCMVPRSPLDDARLAKFAWARFKRLMKFMFAVTILVMAGAVFILYRINGAISVHFYIATALGIGFAMLLMSALMGLVFLSSGTGHDDAIINPLDEDTPL